LGNPCYWVKDVHYALAWEVQLVHGHDLDAIIVFNKMHVGYRVTMEWGIDGLMRKWRQLMKRFDSTKGKYNSIFHATTNYMHKCHMDFTYKFIND
jgi:hypothetical protein